MTKKNNKKKEKDHFYKNKRLLKIDQIDVDKILVLKKNQLNISLGIMIIMLPEHCV